MADFLYTAKQTAALLREAHRVAKVHDAVLITGEPGTDKELLARIIHEWSGRDGLFVAVNCATLADTLVESQLFGHGKQQPGAVRRAAGGTLFLDEIDEFSASHQATLLRLIERGEAQFGKESKPERVDVRVIAAASRDLAEEVKQELFSQDLFHSLQTFQLKMPPVSDYPGGLPEIAQHFIQSALKRHHKRVRFTPEALEATRRLPLGGDLSKLRALIERAVLMAADGSRVTAEAFETNALRQLQEEFLFADDWAGCSFEEEVLRYESNLVKRALAAAEGRVTHAARLLGISHQRLCSMLKERHKGLSSVRAPAERRKHSIITRDYQPRYTQRRRRE